MERRLKSLGKGVGDNTVNIFLGEMRSILKKARPEPSNLLVLAAENLGIAKKGTNNITLEELENFWSRNTVAGKSFANFETALLRLGRNLCKGRCVTCVVRGDCLHRRAT